MSSLFKNQFNKNRRAYTIPGMVFGRESVCHEAREKMLNRVRVYLKPPILNDVVNEGGYHFFPGSHCCCCCCCCRSHMNPSPHTIQSVVAGQAPMTREWNKYLGGKKTKIVHAITEAQTIYTSDKT